MKKLITLATALVIATVAQAWEQTLTTDSVLIVPQVRASGVYADRQAAETVTNGHYRKIGSAVVIAQNTGLTSGQMETNSIVTADTATLVVTGSLTPDATGQYLSNGNGVYTNSSKAWCIWQSAGQYRMTTNFNYKTAGTNKFYASTLVGSYTNGGGYSGVATVAYKPVTTAVITAVAPTLAATGVTTDGTVSWLRVPAQRKGLVFSVIDGDAVLLNANGDKIYKGVGTFELATDQAIYATSTNSAKLEIFQY